MTTILPCILLYGRHGPGLDLSPLGAVKIMLNISVDVCIMTVIISAGAGSHIDGGRSGPRWQGS